MAAFQGLKQSSAEKQIFHLSCKIIGILFLRHHIMRWQVSLDCTYEAINHLTEVGSAQSHSETFRTSKLVSFLLSLALTSCLVSPTISPVLSIAFLPLSVSFPLLLWRYSVLCFLQTICYFYVWIFDDLCWCYRTWSKATVFGCLFVNWIKNYFLKKMNSSVLWEKLES